MKIFHSLSARMNKLAPAADAFFTVVGFIVIGFATVVSGYSFRYPVCSIISVCMFCLSAFTLTGVRFWLDGFNVGLCVLAFATGGTLFGTFYALFMTMGELIVSMVFYVMFLTFLVGFVGAFLFSPCLFRPVTTAGYFPVAGGDT